jgi:hypothetical protein
VRGGSCAHGSIAAVSGGALREPGFRTCGTSAGWSALTSSGVRFREGPWGGPRLDRGRAYA